MMVTCHFRESVSCDSPISIDRQSPATLPDGIYFPISLYLWVLANVLIDLGVCAMKAGAGGCQLWSNMYLVVELVVQIFSS